MSIINLAANNVMYVISMDLNYYMAILVVFKSNFL